MKAQRHLPPTAAPISWRDLGCALLGVVRGGRYRARIEAEMKEYFGVRYLFLLSSGKAALATILRSLSMSSPRRKVVIPAYTCFSVPSAVVRAGCEVVLCDIDPHTLDFRFDQLVDLVDANTLCVVSPHLLGQVADVNRVNAIVQRYNVPVVEDAAQAMGIRHGGQWLGAQGDIGFFSLGRGKHVTVGSGGVVLTNSDDHAEKIERAIQEVQEPPLSSQMANAAIVAAMKLFILPGLYWVPAGLPFLGLGETTFYPDFPIYRMGGMRAGMLSTWQKRLEASNEIRKKRAGQFIEQFAAVLQQLGPSRVANRAYLRLPVMMPTASHKRALCAESVKQGLGISSLYPTPISAIPELRVCFGGQQFPGASMLAERLVTMPVHAYVEQDDVRKMGMLVQALVATESSSTTETSPLLPS